MLRALIFASLTVSVCAVYEARSFPNLSRVEGLNANLIAMHLELYKGYVTNANLLAEKIQALRNKGSSIELAELRRRFGWEFDGMRLHELYFESLAPAASIDTKSSLFVAIEKQFQSFEAWKTDFINAGKMRGIGWVILYFDTISQSLINAWISEHDISHLVNSRPLLVMDVFEHAFITQYGLNKAAYIEVFFQNINWKIVEARFRDFLN